jgi:uncharacterized protein YceK
MRAFMNLDVCVRLYVYVRLCTCSHVAIHTSAHTHAHTYYNAMLRANSSNVHS